MNNLKNDKKERFSVYIDGNNFYGYLKDKEINFTYADISRLLLPEDIEKFKERKLL